jgi:type I restriction enzyme, S subunit
MELNKNNIPESWDITELGDIFTFQKKSNHKAGEGKKSGKYKFFTSSATQDKFLDNYDFDGEFLIFGTGGKPSMHYCNEKFSTSTDCFVVEINKKVLPKYVFYYLIGNMHLLNEGFKGAGLKHISKSYIEKIRIKFPINLKKQNWIANILNEVDGLREKRKKSYELINFYEKTLFIKIFGNPSSNSKKWEIKPFDYFAKIDTNMTTDFDKYHDYPHIGIENIERDTGRLVNYSKINDLSLISGKYFFSNEHIIYSKIRPNLNKVAKPNFDGLCSADSYPILVNKNTNRDFFTHILRSDYFLNYILKFSRRANIPKVNKKQLKTFKCINPPKELQDNFSKIIGKIDFLKDCYLELEYETDNLFHSLIKKLITEGK